MGLRYQQMVKDGNVLYCICTDSTFSFFETSDAFPQTNIAQVIRNAQGLKDVYLSLILLELVVRFTKNAVAGNSKKAKQINYVVIYFKKMTVYP